MFVAGERRGRGVGSALVEAALDWARQVGAHKVSLAVWAHNHPARSLYAKFGFLTEGTRRATTAGATTAGATGSCGTP